MRFLLLRGCSGQVWHLIVSIPDICTLTYFASIMCLFLIVPYINLQCEIVVFPVVLCFFPEPTFPKGSEYEKYQPLRSYLSAMIPYSCKIGSNIREPKSKINNQSLQYLLHWDQIIKFYNILQTLGKHLHSAKIM